MVIRLVSMGSFGWLLLLLKEAILMVISAVKKRAVLGGY